MMIYIIIACIVFTSRLCLHKPWLSMDLYIYIFVIYNIGLIWNLVMFMMICVIIACIAFISRLCLQETWLINTCSKKAKFSYDNIYWVNYMFVFSTLDIPALVTQPCIYILWWKNGMNKESHSCTQFLILLCLITPTWLFNFVWCQVIFPWKLGHIFLQLNHQKYNIKQLSFILIRPMPDNFY